LQDAQHPANRTHNPQRVCFQVEVTATADPSSRGVLPSVCVCVCVCVCVTECDRVQQ